MASPTSESGSLPTSSAEMASTMALLFFLIATAVSSEARMPVTSIFRVLAGGGGVALGPEVNTRCGPMYYQFVLVCYQFWFIDPSSRWEFPCDETPGAGLARPNQDQTRPLTLFLGM